MSSFLCFICHNTVNFDTNEETREKYREVVGMNLCPESQLCYVCHHILNKLWMFKSICLKRSMEYPVLFSEKGTINLHCTDIETVILCTEDSCSPNNASQVYLVNRDHSTHSNDYFKLEDDHKDIEGYLPDTDIDNGKINTEINEIGEDKNNEELEQHSNDSYEDIDNNDDENFENNSIKFENKETNEDRNDFVTENVDNMFDFELNNQMQEIQAEQHNDEYKFYDEGKSGECLNEIRNEKVNQEDVPETSKRKSKSKKSKKKDFEKIVLSLEQQKMELEAQRRSKKYVEAEFKCYNCALGFLFKDTYQAHMMRHEESNGEHVCAVCSLRFASRGVLRSHGARHALRLRCARCGSALAPRQLAAHRRACGERAPAPAATCHLCGGLFRDASGLQQHLRRFHLTKTSNRTYACSVCGKNYNNQAAVRTHMIKHIHQKFTCDQCPSTFSSPYTLTQHKKKHSATDTSADVAHYCSRCDLHYSTRKSLLAHLRTAASHQQRTFECPVCRRACPTSAALAAHVSRVHCAERAHGCACGAAYSTRKSLLRHMRSHTQAEPHRMAVCHVCGNSFKGQSKLNRHLREVCEKDKLEEELSSYYEQQHVI